jgi:hypothetical protein
MRRVQRTIAPLVTLLFLGAVLEAHVHRALARHGFCTEHGEPIHLDDAPRPAPVVDHRSIDSAPHPAHGQHGCALLRFLSQGAEARTSTTHGAELLAHAVAALPLERAPHAAITLLELAPKGSPPA